jgi:hypothetical protein
MSDIVDSFLQLKSSKEIIAQVLDRHTPYIRHHFDRIRTWHVRALLEGIFGILAQTRISLHLKRLSEETMSTEELKGRSYA